MKDGWTTWNPFTAISNICQLSLDDDTSLNIGQLQDPEDFFLAFEKLENAKKELQKQRGEISTDSTQHNQSARSRGPGILGHNRKTVGYKHRYSSVSVNGDEAVAPSQEMFEMDRPGPSNSRLNSYLHGASQGRELAGGHVDAIQDSVAETENRVDTLLDELLFANADLDVDGAFTFLQERLQIKLIKLDNLCLLDLDGIRRSDIKTPVDQFPRERKALSDIHNMITRVEDMHHEVVASKELQLGIDGLTMGSLHCSASQLGEHHPMDGHSEIVDILPGQNNEKPSGMSANEQGKQKTHTCNRRKRKELSHRKSLAGAGTVWGSGVRRSSRIKMRPLEYWRGERFLYGRVHDSLLTVIGVKYESPVKDDGKATLKVKSYVSNEYKELVEKAALH